MTQVNASMDIRILETPAELQAYDAWLRGHAQGNLWQSLEWKAYQESLGRRVKIYASFSDNSTIDASALVVIDTTTGGLSTWDIPRGPISSAVSSATTLFTRIRDDAKKEKCLTLYLSPTSPIAGEISERKNSGKHVQPEATRVVDLTKSDEDILRQMHSKGRYNIALAQKHGIQVTEGTESDMPAFYELLKTTGGRDGFKISQKSHYTRFLSSLPQSFVLMAKHQGKPVSGIMGVQWHDTAFYYYGASSYEHRNLMAPYLLQWEAMRRAKAHGCTRYDLLGISPESAAANDPWQGISDFKRKFGGTVVSYPPEQMIVLKPMMTSILNLKRRILG